ncbi:hypothetical protein GGR54DRAFT_580565 [Hypoxylon sp. NC1633]|nr:hypothetical protein GGR54DRAFT_580565 [Hypoxylon sp. NC1633]
MSSPAGDTDAEKLRAHVVWAAHILSYLTSQRPHVPLHLSSTNEEEEEIEPNELDWETEATIVLTDPLDSIQSKLLDCIAQLLSPAKGWEYVTATAMREGLDFTEITVARNDCFLTAPSTSESVRISDFCSELEKYMSGRSHDTSTASMMDFETLACQYSSPRIDYWINQLDEIILQSDSILVDWGDQRWANLQGAMPLWRTFMRLINQNRSQMSKQRISIIRQAHECISCSEVHTLVHMALEPRVGSRLWRCLKYIARTITDCRLLQQMANRIHEFRNLRVSVVPPMSKTKIKPEHHVDIADAWAELKSAKPPPSPVPSMVKFRESFKRDCAKSAGCHAEIQIYEYLEKHTSSGLTKPYLGCSKKSCLLCEEFLQALHQPIATRGRHGICYPVWGVPSSKSARTLTALKGLRDNLVSRIDDHLKDSRGAEKLKPVPQVPQSSLVSDFSRMTIQELSRREQQKEAAKQEESARIEQRRILEGHASVTNHLAQRPADFEPPDSCVMCNKMPAKLCERCRSCYYCSRECQMSDWSSHKLLCRDFSTQSPRPSPSHKRAILFPVERTKPRLVWVPCELKYSSEDEYDDDPKPYEVMDPHPHLGPDKPSVDLHYAIEYNNIRNRRLGSGMMRWAPRSGGYSIALRFREMFLVDGSPLNGSLLMSLGTLGTLPHPWAGPILAIRQLPSELYEDITLGDLRHVLDYFVSYGTTEVRESDSKTQTHSAAVVRGVKISCYGEAKLHGSDPFVLVDVPRVHPARHDHSRRDVSPISRLLGMPIRLWKYPDLDTWLDPPGWEENMCADSNQNAAFLMVGTNPKKSDWGWAPLYWNVEIGNVLAVRQDGKDLDLNDFRLMCYFARRKLQPMFEDAMGLGLVSRTKQEVRDFITWDNMVKCKEDMMEDDEF